jgi:hypothetical protein
MTESTPDPDLAGAGLSATGRTADQMHPGDEGPGTTYGDPGGTATADQEATGGDPDSEAGQSAEDAPA